MAPDTQTTQDLKQTVVDFFDLAFVQRRPREAADRHMASDYVQHNPQAPDGAEAFVGVIEHILGQAPDATFEVKRVIAEGDLVVIHHLLRMSAEDRGSAVVDIFRVDGGKIVEHWDVLQPVPEASANTNGMV
jgi:predicted SnoaL-like aldol condensation-catalyzing enzyme